LISERRKRMSRAKVQGLESFLSFEGLPRDEEEIKTVLNLREIQEIRIFALGPEGTNISQACRQWADRMGVAFKTKVILCDTPEISLEKARQVAERGVLTIFWTCAVYAKEHEFFFTNPDVLPFFFTEIMDLDEMQFATRQEMVSQLNNGEVPRNWRIASHPSPAPLVRNLKCKVVIVNSNAAAAKDCKEGAVEACITTEKARKIYNLVKVHSFGSPPMVFFGGITSKGAELLQHCYSEIRTITPS